MGVMKMVSAIDVQWVADLIPLLKDPVDVKRLSRDRKSDLEQLEVELKIPDPVPEISEPVLANANDDKEAKLKCLKERFLQR